MGLFKDKRLQLRLSARQYEHLQELVKQEQEEHDRRGWGGRVTMTDAILHAMHERLKVHIERQAAETALKEKLAAATPPKKKGKVKK